LNLRSQLADLEALGLLRAALWQPNPGDPEYQFRHEFIQSVAYQSLVRADRVRLHRSTGEALERAHAGRLDEVAATLALHFERAGEVERAVRYLTLAGDRARSAFANAEALQFYRSALRLLEGQAGPAEAGRAAASAVREGLGDVLLPLGQVDEARAEFEQALALAEEAGAVRRASLHRKIGNALDDKHQLDEAERAYAAAQAALGPPAGPDADWWREWVRLRLDWIMLRYWRGDWQAIAALAEETRPAVEQYGTPSLRARFYDRLAGLVIQRDRYVFTDESVEIIQALLAAANESGDLADQANAEFSLGFARLWRGELDLAETRLQAGLALARRIGHRMFETWCLAYLTVARRKRGQVEAVRDYAARALQAAAADQLQPWAAVARACLAWADLREGRLSEAEAAARAALEIWRPLPVVLPFRWLALWPLLGVCLARGDARQAVEHARPMLAPEQQPQPAAVRAALQAAVDHWDQGRPEAARTTLEQAAELARPLGYL
jgi:hypothetical protein